MRAHIFGLLLLATPLVGHAELLELRDSSLELWMFGDPRTSPIAFPAVTSLQDPASASVSVDASGGFRLPSEIFALTGTVPDELFTGIPLVSGLLLSGHNASGLLGPGQGGGGGFGGAAPLVGTGFVDILGGLLTVQIPLSPWGGGVTAKGTFAQGPVSIQILLEGGVWTTGQVVVTGVTHTTTNGAMLNTVTLSGTDGRTNAHAGALSLVTPVRILTNAAGNRGGFAIANLQFVPEPGTALLFGVAALCLLAGGVHRRGPR